ncbi:MAG: hypothetical protein RJA44_2765 [Pseudomonadota bacterium]|jgi:hypothetical protein
MEIAVTQRRQFLSSALALGLLPGLSWALERPKGKVILTITGNVERGNAAGKAEFDMDMLAALPQHSYTTPTPWYPQERKFTGPLLRDVLAAAGAKGKTLSAVALNDYKVELPVEDVQRFEVVLARLLDDKPMPVREKGPLFIIYPFHTDSSLRSERYYGRCAWQLKTLDVR